MKTERIKAWKADKGLRLITLKQSQTKFCKPRKDRKWQEMCRILQKKAKNIVCKHSIKWSPSCVLNKERRYQGCSPFRFLLFLIANHSLFTSVNAPLRMKSDPILIMFIDWKKRVRMSKISTKLNWSNRCRYLWDSHAFFDRGGIRANAQDASRPRCFE